MFSLNNIYLKNFSTSYFTFMRYIIIRNKYFIHLWDISLWFTNVFTILYPITGNYTLAPNLKNAHHNGYPSPFPYNSVWDYAWHKFLKPKRHKTFHWCSPTLYYYSRSLVRKARPGRRPGRDMEWAGSLGLRAACQEQRPGIMPPMQRRLGAVPSGEGANASPSRTGDARCSIVVKGGSSGRGHGLASSGPRNVCVCVCVRARARV